MNKIYQKNIQDVKKPVKREFSGFTLIELLVVVLIIGILAAIALPHYERAVEKSRVAEALFNAKIIQEQVDLYLLENGWPYNHRVKYTNFASVDLQGGYWDYVYSSYYTKNWGYLDINFDSDIFVTIERQTDSAEYYYDLTLFKDSSSETWLRRCVTQKSNMGRYICKYLEAYGWVYSDTEL